MVHFMVLEGYGMAQAQRYPLCYLHWSCLKLCTRRDVLSDRYGGKVVSVLIAILHYCTMIAICAGQIMAGHLLFEYVGLPGTAGAAITFIIVIGYSTMSGLWGVLMTDVVQSSIIFVVTIVGVIWIFAQGGGVL